MEKYLCILTACYTVQVSLVLKLAPTVPKSVIQILFQGNILSVPDIGDEACFECFSIGEGVSIRMMART